MEAELKDKAALIMVRVIDNKIGVGDGLDQIMDIAFKAGIQEVVDWLNKTAYVGEVFKRGSMAAYFGNPKILTIKDEELQAQLKEWGIDAV